MKDCSHHRKAEGTWAMIQRFLESRQGAPWLAKALENNKKNKNESTDLSGRPPV